MQETDTTYNLTRFTDLSSHKLKGYHRWRASTYSEHKKSDVTDVRAAVVVAADKMVKYAKKRMVAPGFDSDHVDHLSHSLTISLNRPLSLPRAYMSCPGIANAR